MEETLQGSGSPKARYETTLGCSFSANQTSSCQAHQPLPTGPSPSDAVRVPPVMPLATSSGTPWASPRPVQHHHASDEVDYLPRAQHKQVRAGIPTPIAISGVGTMVKERVR